MSPCLYHESRNSKYINTERKKIQKYRNTIYINTSFRSTEIQITGKKINKTTKIPIY